MPRKTKSTLTHHHFPAFYACYLLKSIRTPRSTATYIGSTPSPPRRIRQHNGEITQGAWKTKHNRPWIMQMIVHGFPSRLSALQFEWAWQHPYISRHLRHEDGRSVFDRTRRTKSLKSNVMISRSMISSHPYNTWPLHIKLFTSEAVKAWNGASIDPNKHPLPAGFTCATELEGVDAKSGQTGSGRTGPIDVTDIQFTADHLRKMSALLASHDHLNCSICNSRLQPHPPDPLTTALCPASGCSAVSHLTCLSRDFLDACGAAQAELIPRGGQCKSCGSYTLWGDVIRGCYRRSGGAIPDPESEADDDLEMTMSEDDGAPVPTARAAGPSKRRAKKTTRAVRRTPRESEDEGEFFDLDAVSSSSASAHARSPPKKPRLAAQPKASVKPRATSAKATPSSPRAGMRHHHTHAAHIESEDANSLSSGVGRRFAQKLPISGEDDPAEADSSWERFNDPAPPSHATSATAPSTSGAARRPAGRAPKSTFQDLHMERMMSRRVPRQRGGGGDARNATSATMETGEDHEAARRTPPRLPSLAPFPTLPPLLRPRRPARTGRTLVLTDSGDSATEGSGSPAFAKDDGRRHLEGGPASTSCDCDGMSDLKPADGVSPQLSRALSALSVSSWSGRSSPEAVCTSARTHGRIAATAAEGRLQDAEVIILSD